MILDSVLGSAQQPILKPVLDGSGTGVDPDAAAWATAVTAAGGTYSAAGLAASSTFVKAAKAHGYWAKINRLNLMAGGGGTAAQNLTGCLVPIKQGGGSSTETNNNFVAGDYTESTGLTGNGTTKYLDTGLVPSATLTANDTHTMLYLCGGSQSLLFGASEATNRLLMGSNGLSLIDDEYDAATGRVSGVVTAPYATLIGTRTAANAHAIYQRGASVGSNATSGAALPALSMFLFGWNSAGVVSFSFSNGTGPLGAYSIGSGLSAADASAFSTDLQAFQTALGRNV